MSKKNKEVFTLQKPLKHIAFILDGNGRWAQARLLTRSMGHKAGVKNIRTIIEPCFFTYNIYCASLYVFSTENWNRPEKEIDYLFGLLKQFFFDYKNEFKDRNVRVLVSGDLDDKRIPDDIKEIISEVVEETKDNTEHILNVLFNYGGRREIVDACKKIVTTDRKESVNVDNLNEETFKEYLYGGSILPDVDLLIRTSGEQRISNCVLYELAYAEFIFNKKYWPAYTVKDLEKDLKIYDSRNSRFGGLKNE